MKALGVISTTVLLLVLGPTVPTFAQEASHEQEAKPAAQQEKQAKPAAQQEKQAKPAAQQEKQAKPAAQQEKQAKPAAQQEKQAKPAAQQQPQAKQAKQEVGGATGGQKPPQRSAADQQRQRAVPTVRVSSRGSGRIPDDRFHANFGEGHRFAINQPVIVGGYSRFQYGGYWFGFVQPWPDGWYYTDQVYVDYIDGGYFLFDPFYPGVRVEIVYVQ